MDYVLKISSDGLSVRSSDGLRELATVPRVKAAAFKADGRAIRAIDAAGGSWDLPFHAFNALEGLDRAAQIMDSERSIRTTIKSSGRGPNLRVDYATFRGRKNPVSERDLAEIAKRYGPAPVWVAEIDELDAFAERLGLGLDGPRFELSRLDGVWRVQWWPWGGGLEYRESLRDALALPTAASR